MSKLIRPAGFIAFAAILGIVALSWFLLADRLLKAAVEEGGSRVVGAKVELAAAKTSFSPLGFTLRGLQVTNPDQPMQNMLEVNTIGGKLNLPKLLMGQVIIEDLTATGMRFNTPRKTSGKLEKRVGKKPPAAAASEVPMKDNFLALMGDTLNVDAIMQREPLATLELGKTFKHTTEAVQQTLQTNLAELPDEAKLKGYEEQIKTITQEKIKSPQDLQQRIEQLKQVKQSLQQDRKAILALRDNIRQSKTELKTQYDALKRAPPQDLKKIRDKYSLTDSNIGNFSALLFGDTSRQWLDTLKPWWQHGKKFLQAYGGEEAPPPPPRGEGRYIHFPSRNPSPDFLIRSARVSAELPLGDVDIHLVDATQQQNILGRPTRLSLKGTRLTGLDSFSAEAVLDHVNPKKGKDTVSWQAKNIRLQDIDLIKSDSLPIGLAKAAANITGNLDLSNGQIRADIKSAFSQVHWASKGRNADTVMDILAGITSFDVDTTVEGKPLSPRIAMRSDLDRKLNQALKRKIDQKRAELEQRLEKRLNAEVDKLAGPYKEQLASLTRGEGDINQRLGRIEEMLKAEVNSAAETRKKELQEKAGEELKKKSKGVLKKFGF